MSADVVDFPVKADPVEDQENPPSDSAWTCNCTCSTFYLMADGGIVCANCKTQSTGIDTGLWMVRLPPTDHPATPDHTEHTDSIIDLGDPKRAVESMLTRFKPEQMALIAVIRQDGGVQLWGMNNLETELQLGWLRRKLDVVYEMCKAREIG